VLQLGFFLNHFLLLMLFALLLGSGLVPAVQNSLKNSVMATQVASIEEKMTIPYLRGRNYGDGGVEIIKEYQDHPRYKSYIAYYYSDGFVVQGLLTIPKGEIPEQGFSAIVFVHGYVPADEYKTTQKYLEYVDNLASNDFVVFKIDLRGHGESEGIATGAYFSPDYVVDVINAIESLKAMDRVNGEKIGLWGHSMAGNIVLRGVAARPDIPAVSIWAGAVYSYLDFEKYKLNDDSFVRERDLPSKILLMQEDLFDKVGPITKSSKYWQTVAATNYLDDYKGSVQLQHAKDDKVVDIGYSQDLVRILKEKAVDYEYFEYGIGGHNISSPSYELAMERTIDFFKKELMPKNL